MSNKWDYKHNNEDFYCVSFMSRNKDNKDVENFKQRRQSFLIDDFDELYTYRFIKKFLNFRDEGVKGELSRCYISFNLRDASKVRKSLLIDLIEDDDVSLTHMTSRIVSLAMKSGMNKTKRWMFDVDTLDEDKVNEICEGLELGNKVDVLVKNLSGGQKQRLSIARAIVRRPEIYLFDDSFSALDFKTDAKLRAALASETKDATVIIVAQRVSTVMDATRILVMDEGRVVGCGTHDELLKTNEIYRSIAISQLGEEAVNHE